MEFECQGSNKTCLTKDSVHSVDNSFKEIVLDQVDSYSNPKDLTVDLITETEAPEITEPITEFPANKGIIQSCFSKSFSVDEVLASCGRSITDLPPALISEILNCLDPKELGIVSCVSSGLCSLASEHHVWKEFYCERWGLPIVPTTPLGSGYLNDKSWKELFVEREFQSKTFLGRYRIDCLYGHTEAVRAVFLLHSKKLVFTAGYDEVVRMWNLEEGLSIASSRPLGCTIRAVAADTKLLVAGGSDGFLHGWRAEDGLPHLFELRGPPNQNTEFRLWEHQGPISCLALDLARIYSGSWDMTIRVWDRSTLKCLNILCHNDWVYSLVPHDTTVASSSGSEVYIWDTISGMRIANINSAHTGNVYSLARSHTGNLLFTGGEDGTIHMFEITNCVMGNIRRVATWIPHSGPVYSLAFEFPWLVSASSDGQLSLINVKNLLRKSSHSSVEKFSRANNMEKKNVEPPQRMLHGFGPNLFSVGIGSDRIVCGGEEGVVRIWNFSQALAIESRVRALRGMRLENRMRRRKLQTEMTNKGGRLDQCGVVSKKNGERKGVWNKRGVSGKLKA